MTRFKVSKIAINQFAILQKELPGSETQLSTELSFQHSVESKQIACIADFKFKSSNDTILILTCQCNFAIQADDWKLFEENNEIAIPKSFLETLASQTINISRGILFCKTDGTIFNSLMIPPINIGEMMK
jgi:hypothetical protein